MRALSQPGIRKKNRPGPCGGSVGWVRPYLIEPGEWDIPAQLGPSISTGSSYSPGASLHSVTKAPLIGRECRHRARTHAGLPGWRQCNPLLRSPHSFSPGEEVLVPYHFETPLRNAIKGGCVKRLGGSRAFGGASARSRSHRGENLDVARRKPSSPDFAPAKTMHIGSFCRRMGPDFSPSRGDSCGTSKTRETACRTRFSPPFARSSVSKASRSLEPGYIESS